MTIIYAIQSSYQGGEWVVENQSPNLEVATDIYKCMNTSLWKPRWIKYRLVKIVMKQETFVIPIDNN